MVSPLKRIVFCVSLIRIQYVIKLSDNGLRIIKDTFKTARKFTDSKTLIKRCSKIEEVAGINTKVQTDKEFSTTVLKNYTFYTQNM
ncbi:hypothetical protein BTO04_02760 [Polaribacter sp. SA4-10]|uniref:hypothetical protein n=1 Tax=Polaribacter sp. SA4-10 TaxID=754397 RepID=UPI000B3C0A23|nr:hypothetical protein [Polaribacter sp. SA4-10]ARV05681.1 hypothetical protein BTO04_02760 [Polaribacter sp. SA4-10]